MRIFGLLKQFYEYYELNEILDWKYCKKKKERKEMKKGVRESNLIIYFRCLTNISKKSERQNPIMIYRSSPLGFSA